MIIVITFSSPINESAQVGDTVFAVRNFTTIGGFRQSDLTNTLEIGHITRDFNPTSQTPGFNNRDGSLNAPIEIYVEKTTSANINLGDYIVFSKNKIANTSGLVGYYASVKMVNDSSKKVELFSVGSDITINSN